MTRWVTHARKATRLMSCYKVNGRRSSLSPTSKKSKVRSSRTTTMTLWKALSVGNLNSKLLQLGASKDLITLNFQILLFKNPIICRITNLNLPPSRSSTYISCGVRPRKILGSLTAILRPKSEISGRSWTIVSTFRVLPAAWSFMEWGILPARNQVQKHASIWALERGRKHW